MFGVLSVKTSHAQRRGHLCDLGGVRPKVYLIVPDACIISIGNGETNYQTHILWEENWVISEIHLNCAKHIWMERIERYPQIHVHRYTLTPISYKSINIYKTPQNGFVVCAINNTTMV